MSDDIHFERCPAGWRAITTDRRASATGPTKAKARAHLLRVLRNETRTLDEVIAAFLRKEGFPIMWPYTLVAECRELGCPRSLPWAVVEPAREQAMLNHGQSLEQLAKRGGLDPVELAWALQGRSLRGLFNSQGKFLAEAIAYLRGLELDLGDR